MATAREYWDADLEGKAESTRHNYVLNLDRFLEWAGWTAEELYEKQRDSMKAEDPREGKVVALKVRNYMKHLVEEGYKGSTANIVYKAVRSFMDANELAFEIKPKDRPRRIYSGQRVIRPDQIRRLYDHVGNRYRLRNRALIMMAKDSGLRVGDIAALNVDQILGARRLIRKNDVFLVLKPFTTIKTADEAHVHLGPESVEAVMVYIGDRTTGPLFMDQTGGRMTRIATTLVFGRLCDYLGEEGFKVSAHSFRKFFVTRLQSEMDGEWIKRLQGKAADPYSHPEQTGELTDAYIAAYDRLRVFEVAPSAAEVERLKVQVAELETKMEDQFMFLQRIQKRSQPKTVKQIRRRRES